MPSKIEFSLLRVEGTPVRKRRKLLWSQSPFLGGGGGGVVQRRDSTIYAPSVQILTQLFTTCGTFTSTSLGCDT